MKIIVILLCAIALCACQRYQPQPLRESDLTKTLASPDKKILAYQAARLEHSRISPIQLDFSKPLTAQELAVITVLVNPDLKALRAKANIAQAQVFAAGLLPDPQLLTSIDPPMRRAPELVNGYLFDVSWDIAGIVTRHIKMEIAKKRQKQTRYDIAWQEWLFANQAELLATRSYFLEQQQKVAQEAMQQSQYLLDITRRNVKKHDAKIDDLGLQQAAYLEIQDHLQTVGRALQKNRLELNQTLGLPPTELIAVGKPRTIITATTHFNSEDLFAKARNNRLDLTALQAGYVSQEASVHQAILGQYPRVTLGITRARDTSNLNTLGGILGMDIPLFNRNRGAIAVEQATRNQLYQEYIARLHQTRTDIAILVTDMQRIQQAIKTLEKELPEMRRTEQAMRAGLKEGNITLINYERVRTGLLMQKLKLLALQQEAAEQKIALQMASGRFL